MIELKSINLSKCNLEQQVKKCKEEEQEFKAAYLNYTFSKAIEDRENLIEEFWDTMQSKLGLLNMLGIETKEVTEGYSKHLEKIKNRPRGRV